MSYFWSTLRVGDGRIEVIECYPTLDSAHIDMATLAWGEPTNHWLDFVTDDRTGEVVATALFGSGLELLNTCWDGRRCPINTRSPWDDRDRGGGEARSLGRHDLCPGGRREIADRHGFWIVTYTS